jgi:hypothetical protein
MSGTSNAPGRGRRGDVNWRRLIALAAVAVAGRFADRFVPHEAGYASPLLVLGTPAILIIAAAAVAWFTLQNLRRPQVASGSPPGHSAPRCPNPRCGRPLVAGKRFCIYCGRRLR